MGAFMPTAVEASRQMKEIELLIPDDEALQLAEGWYARKLVMRQGGQVLWRLEADEGTINLFGTDGIGTANEIAGLFAANVEHVV